jgi:hypothetical protein
MLKKLSLAALVAMGSMSVASATDLSQAIQGVDLSGFLRIRYYNESPENDNSYNRWRTNAVLIFKVPVSDEISLVMRNSVETNVYTDDDTINPNGTSSSNVDDSIVNNLLFAKYSKDGLNVILGKIPVATSVTSADPAKPGHGAGAIATYAVNENLTVGAAYIDALVNPQDNTGLGSKIPNAIYAAVAVFNADMVSGNVWYYHATNAIKSLYTVSLDVKPMDGVKVHGDYAAGKLSENLLANAKTKSYFNVSAAFNASGIDALVGYAKTDKDAGVVELSDDAPIGAVIPTANNYNIANETDMSSIYCKLGYNVDAKTNVYVAYQHANDKTAANDDLDEYTVGAKYKYNKKLGFHAYYDVSNFKAANEDNNEFRFEAKYKF